MDEMSRILAEIMAGLTFFRQERVDGGVRTGIMNGVTGLLELFEIECEEFDPSLAWSIDLRCNGPGLPTSANDAREWFLSHEVPIRDGFRRFADRLEAGSDPTGIHLPEWSEFHDLPPGLSMKIVYLALRRIDALYLATRLRFVGENWTQLINSLEPLMHEAL